MGLLIWGFPVFSPYHPVSLSPHQQDRNTRFCLLVQRTSCLSTKAERPHGYRQLGVSRYAVDPVHWQSLGAWPDSLDRHPRGVAVPPPLFQPFGLRRTHPTREQVPYPGAGLLPLADIRPLSPGREVGMSLSTLRDGTCITWLRERRVALRHALLGLLGNEASVALGHVPAQTAIRYRTFSNAFVSP